MPRCGSIPANSHAWELKTSISRQLAYGPNSHAWMKNVSYNSYFLYTMASWQVEVKLYSHYYK